MWQRFTERARKVVFYAQEEAVKWGANLVGPEFLLLGLVREDDSLAARLLIRLDVSLDSARKKVQARLQPGEGGPLKDDLQLTPAAKKVIDFAYEEANRLGDNYIGTEHLLLGLLHPEAGVSAEVLKELGVTHEGICERLEEIKIESKLLSENPADELLTLDEAVKFLGTSKPTLYRLLGQDEIKGLKVGRQWRFRKADLVAYMERSPVAVNAAPQEDLHAELAFFAAALGQSAPDGTGDAESKTIALANFIVQLAIASKASDIHLEPTPDDLLLRFRIDGVLQEIRRLPSRMKESLTAQFKTLADMNLSETRLPQDGRILFPHDGKEFDLRVSTLPSLNGEALTLRIFDRSRVPIGLEKLGLTPEDLAQIRGFLGEGNGVVIAAGPAGAGKTTLLYSCLKEAASLETRTLTVEDPVESVMAHTTQVAVSKKSGLTFAAALRAFLRQDPDTLMVGALNDLEVLQLVVEAARTGHLVLCGLEADTAASALVWLLDLGIEPPPLTATVKAVIAVRLCRRLCDACKAPLDSEIVAALLSAFSLPADATLYEKRGCERCRGQGYLGHIGLYEILPMSGGVVDAVFRNRPAAEIAAAAVADGMRTLFADGLRQAAAGLTTVEEVLHTVSEPA
jgi:excisionase family DNA binding protein